MIPLSPIIVAFLLAISGFPASGINVAPSVDATAPTPLTTDNLMSDTDTTQVEAPTRLQLSLVDATRTSEGAYESFTLLVRGNTSLPSSDGGDEGEPFFLVQLNGYTLTETEEVTPDPDGRYRIPIPTARLASNAGEEVTIEVTLFDRDLFIDDQIASARMSVLIADVAAPEITSTPTPTDTATPTPTDTGTSAPINAGFSQPEDQARLQLSLVDATRTSGGAYESFTLLVRGNTSLPSSDGGDEGEPFFLVQLNGDTLTETEEVTPDPDGRYRISIPTARLGSNAGEEVTIEVTLFDRDLFIDDQIASARTSVLIADAAATPTTTPTTTSTPTPTETAQERESLSQLTPVQTPTKTATPTPVQAVAETRSATVMRVVDGDTLKIKFEDGTPDTVRLIGVDTPESLVNTPEEFEGIPNNQAGADCLRRYGEDASAFVTDRLEGEQVTLRFDEQADRRGYYGRLLVYVLHDGKNINYQLVADGYGRVYDSSFSQSERFNDAESNAQRAARRVWSCRDVSTPTPTPEPTSPPTPYGGSSGSLSVVDIHANADGNDHYNRNGEYITFENSGSETLDLSGWTITDGIGEDYNVPDGFSLAPGATVTLYTGTGTDTSTELYWGFGRAIWNNDGDTVIVRDASGEEVLRRSY